MFGSKNDQNGAAKPGKGAFLINQCSEGTFIQGDIQSSGDIRVDGVITGTVNCTSKIAIGRTGKVDGDIICGSADIEGQVTGTLKVKDILILKKTAVINGDIVAAKFVMEEGAVFNGTCSMSSRELKHEKQGKPTLQKEAI
jgi:cytoskeletal protein CcmA (bactofilin family)